jgi:hypothetical protein
MMVAASGMALEFVAGQAVAKVESFHHAHAFEHFDHAIDGREIDGRPAGQLVDGRDREGVLLLLQDSQDGEARPRNLARAFAQTAGKLFDASFIVRVPFHAG